MEGNDESDADPEGATVEMAQIDDNAITGVMPRVEDEATAPMQDALVLDNTTTSELPRVEKVVVAAPSEYSTAPTPRVSMEPEPEPEPRLEKKNKSRGFKIKSWEEIASEASGALEAISKITDFERLQKAQETAARKGSIGPVTRLIAIAAIIGLLVVIFMPEPPPKKVLEGPPGPERCKDLRICYPLGNEPTCENPSDCVAKAQTAYNVADEFLRRKDANITNRYEAYKQLDKAARFVALGNLDEPPQSMRDLYTRYSAAEAELDRIQQDYQILLHQSQQRHMYWDAAKRVRAWQAFFPDKHNDWFQEAIQAEQDMRSRGTWPQRFDPKPKVQRH